jgi:ABC-2 type transport system permease protein
MNKILLIIQREYLTRVKKRSFVIMTLLGPILMASVWIVPVLLATRADGTKIIEVIDETGLFYEKLAQTDKLKFIYSVEDVETAKASLSKDGNFGLLHIPRGEQSLPRNFYLYSYQKAGLGLKQDLQAQLGKIIEERKLQDVYGIDPGILSSVKTRVSVTVQDLNTNEESFTELSWALGFIGGMLIYFFIFMYGAQVMRGVIEEKTNRIVEIMVSSVRPIQLMTGKIIGIAMVGMTQFMLWILLTLAIVTGFSAVYADQIASYKLGGRTEVAAPGQLFTDAPVSPQPGQQGVEALASDENIAQLLDIFFSINYFVILGTFLFYFIGGYLLYAAMFAAIGSAVDNDADTQQFMLPVTIPLILSIVLGFSLVINNPDGSAAYWLSIIPFTSPIAMMIRVPFGVNIYTDLLPSALLLIAGFLLTTWIAARIYRIGILMYGKKVTYSELWKWMRYRQ